jgi:DNA-binding Lrp family transcriptional regulator
MIDDKHKLDKYSVEFLRVVDSAGGSASTRKIREESDLSTNQIHYRFDKLADMDYIEIRRIDVANRFVAMKQAVLTAKAKQAIDEGVLVEAKKEAEKRVSEDELAEKVNQLEEQVEYLESERERIIDRVNKEILPIIDYFLCEYSQITDQDELEAIMDQYRR